MSAFLFLALLLSTPTHAFHNIPGSRLSHPLNCWLPNPSNQPVPASIVQMIGETGSEPSTSNSRSKRSLLISGSGFAALAAYGLSTAATRFAAAAGGFPILGGEEVMSKKAHGTSISPVQSLLRWSVDVKLADRICNFNRNWAEQAGYWTSTEVSFLAQADKAYADAATVEPMQFYDSVTGVLLFTAPVGRSYASWREESMVHGWPSFRDNEVNWDNVRGLRDGETVSLTGTHLGHNLPDRKGNRYW